MAKKLTPESIEATRGALGLQGADTAPVDIKPLPASAAPDTVGIQSQKQLDEIAEYNIEASFMEALGAAFLSENSLVGLSRMGTEGGFEYDHSFNSLERIQQDKELLDTLQHADQEELYERLGAAQNEAHYDWLLQNAEDDNLKEQAIQSAGGAGFGARMIAAIGDPIELSVAAATGGGSMLLKGGRMANALRTGAVVSGTNMAIEGVIADQNVTRRDLDIVFAGAAGFGLGSLIGGASRATSKSVKAAVEKELRNGPDSVGSARTDFVSDADDAALSASPSEIRARQIAGDEPAPEFHFRFLQKLQVNLQGRLFFSADADLRSVAANMLEGGHQKSGARKFTAEGRANHLHRTFENNMYKSTLSDFKEWADSQNIGWFGRNIRAKPGEDFYSEVALALRDPEWARVSPQAQAAAKKIRPMLDDYWEMGHKLDLPGFAGTKPDNYFPRMYQPTKVLAARTRYGEKGLKVFFREALMNAVDDMPEELATRVAAAYTRRISRTAAGMDEGITNGIPLDDLAALKEFFDGDEDLDKIVDLIEGFNAQRKEVASGGDFQFAKRRTVIDEGYEMVMPDGSTLRLHDLVENDARRVLGRYSQVMSGHLGLAQEAGIKSRSDLNAVKRARLQRAMDEGSETQLAKAQDEVEALEQAYKLITGTSLDVDPHSALNQGTRVMRSYNYSRVGGSFGVAQLPEAALVLAEGGFVQFLRNVPALRQVLKRGADGQLEMPLARAMDDMFSPGTDWIRNPAISAQDDFGEGFSDSAFGNLLKKIDPALQSAGRLTGALSLMAPVNASLQRLAGITYAQRMFRLARKSKLSDSEVARLRAAGISEEMQERVFKGLKENSTSKGAKLEDVSTEWADREAQDFFRMAGHREMRRMIQENDFGNTSAFAQKAMGRVIFQFMSFMLNSVNKQLLYGVAHRDITTFVAFNTAMFFGGMAYIGQTVVNHQNNPKRLKERLEPGMVARAAFSRAGWTAILVPTIDNALWLTGHDPAFAHARTSGLGTTLLTSNPTVAGIQDLANAARMPIAMLGSDYTFSQEDSRRLQRLAMFQRTLALQNLFDMIHNELPKRSQRD